MVSYRPPTAGQLRCNGRTQLWVDECVLDNYPDSASQQLCSPISLGPFDARYMYYDHRNRVIEDDPASASGSKSFWVNIDAVGPPPAPGRTLGTTQIRVRQALQCAPIAPWSEGSADQDENQIGRGSGRAHQTPSPAG